MNPVPVKTASETSRDLSQSPASPLASAITLVTLIFILSATGCRAGDDGNSYSVHDKHPLQKKDFAIAIHGGAGVISRDIDPEVRDGYLASLEEAARIGRDILDQGGSSLDAVEIVIRFMEDDERYNAGKGSVFTSEGTHELDASIMDGRDLNAGAVAGVRTVRNPITLARLVMEQSRHVMFSGDGAELFADQMDVERVDNSYFSTDRRKRQLENAREQMENTRGQLENTRRQIKNARGQMENAREQIENARGYLEHLPTHPQEPSFRFGTVGAVALDRHGNLAAGTSTGGMTNKMTGRIGDSPVIAAGTYADNNSCAVSATGHGEKFIRNAVAYQICAIMEYGGATLEEAAKMVIHEKLDEGDGGIIAVDKWGNIVFEFSSPGMFRAAADSDGRFEAAIWE